MPDVLFNGLLINSKVFLISQVDLFLFRHSSFANHSSNFNDSYIETAYSSLSYLILEKFTGYVVQKKLYLLLKIRRKDISWKIQLTYTFCQTKKNESRYSGLILWFRSHFKLFSKLLYFVAQRHHFSHYLWTCSKFDFIKDFTHFFMFGWLKNLQIIPKFANHDFSGQFMKLNWNFDNIWTFKNLYPDMWDWE